MNSKSGFRNRLSEISFKIVQRKIVVVSTEGLSVFLSMYGEMEEIVCDLQTRVKWPNMIETQNLPPTARYSLRLNR